VQIIADVTGRRVFTIEQNVEAAMGAALLAAIGIGWIGAEDARKGWITLTLRSEPRQAQQQVYDRLFGVYVGLYPALKSSMHTLRQACATDVPSPP
jgi:xylulokinase